MRRRAVVLLGIAGFPLLVLTLLAIVVGGVIRDGHRLDDFSVRLGIPALLLAAGFGRATVAAMRRRLAERAGVDVTGEPELAGLIAGLAGLAGTRVPDRVLLIDEVNAYVREHGRRRELHLGAQLFAGLTVAELASVLAHELGHYARGDTRLAPLVRRAAVTISMTADLLPATMWRFLLRSYQCVFHLLICSVSRRQERLADRLAITATGRSVAVEALRGLRRVEASWLAFDERYLRVPGGAREPVANILDEFAAFYRREPVEVTAAAEPSPWNSHPTVEQRIRSLLAQPAGTPWLVRDDRPASCLITTRGLDDLLAPGGCRETLAVVAERRRVARLVALAAPLGRAVRDLSGRKYPQVGDLTALLGDQRLAERTRQEVFTGAHVPLKRRVEAVSELAEDLLPLESHNQRDGRTGAMLIRLGRAPYVLIVHHGLLWLWPVVNGDRIEAHSDRIARRLADIRAGTVGPQIVRIAPAQVVGARLAPGRRFGVDLTVGDGTVVGIRAAWFGIEGRRTQDWKHELRTVAQGALVGLTTTGGRGDAAEPFDAGSLTRAEWSRRAGTKRNHALMTAMTGVPFSFYLLTASEGDVLLGWICALGTSAVVAALLTVARSQRRKSIG